MGSRLGTWLQGRKRRTVAAGGALVAVTLVVVVVLVINSMAPSATLPSPEASPSSSATATTMPNSGEWTALQLAPYVPVAELVPVAADGAGIDPADGFTFRSLGDVPAVELAAGLRATPAAELRVEPGPTADVAIVLPITPLAAGARYRFELRRADGSLAAEWTFRTGGPLHVVRTLPSEHATQVPLATGIEIEFDQDGATAIGDHVSIAPALAGRWEQHGRTWAYVPDVDLAAETLYTVTVAPGIRIADSDQLLEAGTSFSFETAGLASVAEATIVFQPGIQDMRPGDNPAFMVDVRGEFAESETLTRRVEVYRLPDAAAALLAARSLSVDRSWATRSSTGIVPTEGLSRVAAVDASVLVNDGPRILMVPVSLAEGWYLVNLPQAGRNGQALVQVGNLAAYAAVSTTRTVIWVNDLELAAPVAGAQVAVSDGPGLGTAGSDGLLNAVTPAELRTSADSGSAVLLVTAPDGRRLIAPLRGSAYYERFGGESAWWSLFETDRTQYRQDDTIHAWGVVRSRADRGVPGTVEIRLTSNDGAAPLIDRTSVSQSQRGAFTASVDIHDLPLGDYTLTLFVGNAQVASTWIQVTQIRKPTFQIEVSTEQRAYVAGDTIHAQAMAHFYDGSPAPGLELRVSPSGVTDGRVRTMTAAASGGIALTLTAATSDQPYGSGNVYATVAQPEEGTSDGEASFAVFPSRIWLTADATTTAGTTTITGTAHAVDLALASAQMAERGWVTDPSGAPSRGQTVRVDVVRVTWTSRVTGTTYDFLQKKRVPMLSYDRHESVVGTFRATADGDGQFELTVPAGTGDGWLEITLTATDSGGRSAITHAYAGSESGPGDDLPRLTVSTQDEDPSSYTTAAPGETVSVDLRDANGRISAGPRTLFLVAHQGIQQAAITTSGRLQRTFGDADLPNVELRAVQLLATGYLVSFGAQVVIDREAKAIEVAIVPDRATHAPGEDVTLSIRTNGPDGSPIAADVVVRVLDQKLFDIGAAQELATGDLMNPVASGFIASYTSHLVNPSPFWGDGFGATSGGGDSRADFRDIAAFERIVTDSAGHGSMTFTLPDDLTTWHASAAAIGAGLESGIASLQLPATLSLFVDATIAAEYLVGETPIIRIAAYGDGLAQGDAVRFTVAAPTLGMPERSYPGTAFTPLRVPLPELVGGDHMLTIGVEAVGASPRLQDRLIRTIHVVPTRLHALMTGYLVMGDGQPLPGGDGMTTYLITDAGRGALVSVLQQLASGASPRMDEALAADAARMLLIEAFGIEASSLPASGWDPARALYGDGLRLLPYDSPDLFLSARTAQAAPERVSASALSNAFDAWATDEAASRERRVVALAGMAALGQDVAAELRSLAGEDLTVREQLWCALGLHDAGDVDGSRAMERSILERHASRLGQWVRIESPVAAEGIEATGLMLLLSARLGDPIAADLARYIVDNPSSEQIAPLELLGYVRAALEWLPRGEARFAWTVSGERHEESLEPGASFVLPVTAEQRATLRLEPLAGELMIAASWAGEARYDELPRDALLGIARTVIPAADAPSDGLVRVSLKLTVSPNAPSGCIQVTDLLPSGLAPLVAPWSGDPSGNVLAPYEVVGQRVSWCIDAKTANSKTLAYTAHVVTAGTYRWEPAVAQMLEAPEVGTSTAPMTYTVR